MNFASIAPYLKDPLILIGFGLFLAFLFARSLLKAGIIPPLPASLGYQVLQRLLLYGFVIGLAIIGLGFGLKYKELSEREQSAAVRLLRQELAGNLKLLSELKSNTETILNLSLVVNNVLRTPRIRLLAVLFPADNLDTKKRVAPAAEMASDMLKRAFNDGLINDELERRKFHMAASAVAETIRRTSSTVRSLADPNGVRYVLKAEVWESQLPILRKVNIIDVTIFQEAYQELNLIRANYNVVVAKCIDYLDAVQIFFSPVDNVVNRDNLAAVLAAERLYMTIITEYSMKLLDGIKLTEDLRSKIDLAIKG